jgi:hypothetical protein
MWVCVSVCVHILAPDLLFLITLKIKISLCFIALGLGNPPQTHTHKRSPTLPRSASQVTAALHEFLPSFCPSLSPQHVCS